MLNYNYSFEKAKQKQQKDNTYSSNAPESTGQGNYFVRSHKRSDSVALHGKPLELLDSPILGGPTSRKPSHYQRSSLDTLKSNHSLYRRDSADTPPESPISLDKGITRPREPSIDLDVVSAQSENIIRRQQALVRQGSATMIKAPRQPPLSPSMAENSASHVTFGKEKPRSYSISYQPHGASDFSHQDWKETPRTFIRRCESAGILQRNLVKPCNSHVKRSLSQNDCKSSQFDLKSFLMEQPEASDDEEHQIETDSGSHTSREDENLIGCKFTSLKSEQISLPPSSENLLAKFDGADSPQSSEEMKQPTKPQQRKSLFMKPTLSSRSSAVSRRLSKNFK